MNEFRVEGKIAPEGAGINCRQMVIFGEVLTEKNKKTKEGNIRPIIRRVPRFAMRKGFAIAAGKEKREGRDVHSIRKNEGGRSNCSPGACI